MGKNHSAAVLLPWSWVIESLANYSQVEAPILIDLVKRIPGISHDLGKNAREMVSLRVLESLFDLQNKSANDSDSASDAKIHYDPSECCEYVLRHVLHETSGFNLVAKSKSKLDLQPFIMNKRSCLPKCALQQLKEIFLEGSHPALAALKESSGLNVAPKNKTVVLDNCATVEKKGLLNGGNERDKSFWNENLLPAKRGRDESANQIPVEPSHDYQVVEKMVLDESSPQKKHKQDSFCSGETVDLSSDSLYGTELIEDSPGRGGENAGREASSKELLVVNCALTKLDKNHHVDVANLGSRQQIPCDVDGEPKDKDQMRSVDDHREEAESPDRTRNVIQVEKAKDHSEQIAQSNELNTSASGEGKEKVDQFSEPDIFSDSDSYDDEKTEIAAKKSAFLSSQCAYSQDSSGFTEWSELHLCMKCNQGGQLLVCNSEACPLVVHHSCLGYAASYNGSEKFYCPFCVYSRAISEYLEVKRKASLARKCLEAFIRSASKFEQSEDLTKSDDLNDGITNANTVNDALCKPKNVDVVLGEPSVSCINIDLPCGENGLGVSTGEKCVLVDRDFVGQPNCTDEIQMESAVVNQPVKEMSEIAPPSSTKKKTAREKLSPVASSHHSGRSQKRKPQYTPPSIPQIRRKNLPWTKLEEQTLKEGVQRFSSDGDRGVPWKKILDHGGTVFQSRTTIDLKDKWRNICRGSPKSI